MSDAEPKTPPEPSVPSPAPTEPAPPPDVALAPGTPLPSYIPGAPLAPQGLVRGGTSSGAYDKEMALRLSEADARRAQDAAERQLGTIPIEQGGAVNYERKFADPVESPRVLLAYVGWGKEIIHEQLCELIYDDTTVPPHNILIFVCPECFRRGVPSQFAQIHVRDIHRGWSLDTRNAGTIKAVKNDAVQGGMEFYTYAGRIMDTDVLGCDNVNCGAKFKISKNRLYRTR